MNDVTPSRVLSDELGHIRESVRALFEELRLRGEDGDVSGKERLERVPALAKRNFGNLMKPNSARAATQAWRLLDFLEGGDGGRLTPLAREGLRVAELDARLAKLRATAAWREAACCLREALDASLAMHEPLPRDGGASPPDLESEDRAAIEIAPSRSRPRIGRRFLVAGALVGAVLLGSAAWLGVPWSTSNRPDARTACLAFEDASPSDIAAHRDVGQPTPIPPPPPDPARPAPLVYVISDPSDGGSIRSVFTTSQFSFDRSDAQAEEGGGEADLRLRVGGWGDTYLSLLQFPLPDDRPARRAVIRLVVIGDEPASRPTGMTLRQISEPWIVQPGPHNRLWWRDCPNSQLIARNLPAPGPSGSHYDIDITDAYNRWMRYGANYGIMLAPENIGAYGPDEDQYPSFSTFYSTRANDPANRPKLIVNY